ncbi:serine hydrolase [Sphingobacterium oryzagri]|uniref:Serine hydrolase n=1 Tax=Sphingobacterium oryzagri TaxID=3025669 RepID=A0ABY7WMT7_9SPHI|nr:serine hydrolase [Sphingobacterium sp. KACC 22765]WDF69987.1 serine hydrolase [Sphingobacterium sp. KACC 22765]
MKSRFLFIGLLLTMVVVHSCKLTRFVVYNYANITDYKIFPSREINTSSTPFVFAQSENPRTPKKVELEGKDYPFDQYLIDNHTVAFLVIQNDSIQYENYFNDYSQASIVASFSMAKSITSLLIGIAIDEGLIKSVDEPITNYIPELLPNGFAAVKIRHLLQMTSGLDFNEGYQNPFGHVATFYYGNNLRKAINKLKLAEQPGERFRYTSGQTQLLGLVLERALKNKTVSTYLEEKVWQPLGMEYKASWSIDRKKDGLEKTFCCVNARARDFAKIGRLYLNKGKSGDRQIVSEKWVRESTKIDTSDGSAWFYQYQWWLPTKEGDFMAKGILGQFIYVNPSKNLIMVRLGEKTGNVDWNKFLPEIAQGY